MSNKIFFIFIFLLCIIKANALQHGVKLISIHIAVKEALANSPSAKAAELKLKSALANKNIIDLGTTSFEYQYGQLYGPVNDRSFAISQNFGAPLTHIRKNKYSDEVAKLTETEQTLTVKQVTSNAKTAYINWLYNYCKLQVITQELGRYNQFMNLEGKLRDLGDSGLLEKTMVETKYADIQNQQFQSEMDYHVATNQLQELLYINDSIAPADTSLELYAIQARSSGIDKFLPTGHISYFESQYNVSNAQVGVEQSKLSPSVMAGYFNQQINHANGFEGFKLGVFVPLWFFPQRAKITEALINRQIAANELEYQKFYLGKTIENLKIQLDQYFVSISFYRENALNQADLLIKTAISRYQRQVIGTLDFLESLETALKIKLKYLETIKMYNQTAIQLEYYVN